MATIAVFIALGGASYAAITLPKNSVGSKQLKKKAVTPKKVAPKTVKLFKGQKGDKGDRGLTGTGAPGSDAASMITGNTSATLPGTANTFKELAPSGRNDNLPATLLAVTQSAPNVDV